MEGTLEIGIKTPRHEEIICRLRDLIARSRRRRESDILRFDYADQIADSACAIPAEEITQSRNSVRPTYKTIKVSYSYAAMMADLTYEATVFLSRNPVIQLSGQTADAMNGEMAFETFLQYQLRQGGAIPHLYQSIRDKLQYAQGIVGICWEESEHTISALYTDESEGKKQRRIIEADFYNFVGNRVYGIRPHDWIFDPTFSFASFQKGEYAGEFSCCAREAILRGFSDGTYIKANKKAFEDSKKASGFLSRWEGKARSGQYSQDHQLAGRFDDDLDDHYSVTGRKREDDKPFAVEILDLYVKVIPKEWGLGQGEKSGIWQFRVANGEVLLSVRPCSNLHGQFPYSVAPGDIDLYRVSPISQIERAIPFEETMNWLINSHFYNVRQHLNNSMVVDPSRIMLQDVFRRHPSGMIRVKPEAYGQDVRTALYQLQVGDVTGQHLNDMRTVEEMAQKVLGTNDNILGQVHPGGRKTATEIRTSTSFSTNRLKVMSEFGSSLFWQGLSTQMIKNTQQYFNAELMLRTTASDDVNKFLKVTPEVISGGFLYEPADGTLPIDRQGQAQLFGQIFQQLLSAAPHKYDGDKMMRYLGELLGGRNIPKFELLPEEQLQRQLQSGQAAPLPQPGGQQNGAGPQQVPG